MGSTREVTRTLGGVLTGLLLVALLPLVSWGVAADVCPEEGKVESQVDGDLDDIVLDAGTLVCIKAGQDLVTVVADGEQTLAELIGNGHNVSHYTVIETTTTTTAEGTSTTQGDPEPTTTTIFNTTTTLATTTTEGTLVLGGIEAVCIGDIPFLSYAVDFPGATEVDITFLNPGGEDFTYPGAPLSGQVLWPGASDVFPFDWPGWELVDGVWIEADDGFLWARETVTVVFTVNPTTEVEVDYPEATAECANPTNAPPGAAPPTSSPPTLPFTGSNLGPFAAVGAALVAAGLVGLSVARRRSD